MCAQAADKTVLRTLWDSNMKIAQNIISLAIVIAFALSGTGQLLAQTTAQNVGAATTEAQKKIGFRLANWQTKHIHNVAEAEKLIASLEKIGCEVTKADHNGHLDVRYRCPAWKSITVENDEYQKQWATWLAGQGMETVVIAPPATPGLELVRFRRTEWHNLHMHDEAAVAKLVSMLKMIGCDAEKHEHNGHIDVRFRCREWSSISLHNHDAAHKWQNWLNELGFETEHTH